MANKKYPRTWGTKLEEGGKGKKIKYAADLYYGVGGNMWTLKLKRSDRKTVKIFTNKKLEYSEFNSAVKWARPKVKAFFM